MPAGVLEFGTKGHHESLRSPISAFLYVRWRRVRGWAGAQAWGHFLQYYDALSI